MRTRAAVVAVSVIVTCLCSSPSAADVAWIANVADSTVSRIDLATHEAVTVAVGTFPQGVAASRDGLRAYVSNADDGTVSVIDATVPQVIATLPVGAMPRGMAVTPDGSKAYAALASGDVIPIDAATLTAGAPIFLGPLFGGASLDVVAMSPSGARLYVGKQEGLFGSVAVIDTATDAFVADVLVTAESFQMLGVAVSADGTRLWATAWDVSSVFEVDTATNLLVREIPFDCSPGCGSGQGLVPHPDGSLLYVAMPFDHRIAVIDLAAGAEVRSIDLPGSPTGIDVTPDGARLYVPSSGDTARIEIIDTASETIVGTLLSVGELPFAPGRFIIGDPTVPPPPELDASARRCQGALAGSWKRFAVKVHKSFATCFKRVLADVASGKGTAGAAAACAKALDPAQPTSTVSRARAAARVKVLADCASVTPAAVAQPCSAAASTMSDVADCVLDAQTRLVAETVAAEYGAACSLAEAAGLSEAYPALCATP